MILYTTTLSQAKKISGGQKINYFAKKCSPISAVAVFIEFSKI